MDGGWSNREGWDVDPFGQKRRLPSRVRKGLRIASECLLSCLHPNALALRSSFVPYSFEVRTKPARHIHLELPTDLIRGFGELRQARLGDPQTLMGSFPPSQGACDRCLLPTIFKERVPTIMCITRSWLPRDPVNQAFSRRSIRFGPTSREDSGVIFLASLHRAWSEPLAPRRLPLSQQPAFASTAAPHGWPRLLRLYPT